VATNWEQSSNATFAAHFENGAIAAAPADLTGRGHFGDLQFLHGMAARVAEAPHDTLAKILLWSEVVYRLSIGEGLTGATTLAAAPVTSSVPGPSATFSYTLA